MKLYKWEEQYGMLSLVDNSGEIMGWVLKAQEGKWVYNIPRLNETSSLFESEEQARYNLWYVVTGGWDWQLSQGVKYGEIETPIMGGTNG